MHLDYLQNHKKVECSGFMLSGKLKAHIEDIDRQAEELFFQLVKKMAKDEKVTESLKWQDQMLWVQRMNSIRNRAEEIVNHEIIMH